MKLPNPHQFDHKHFRRCMAACIFSTIVVHVFAGYYIGVVEGLIGITILYDPTA